MRKRNCRVEICFTEDELAELKNKARKSNLSIGGFVRRAVRDLEVKEAPPADMPMLVREVRGVGYNIDQLLRLANAKGLLDVPQLRKALADNRAVEKMIVDTYTMLDN